MTTRKHKRCRVYLGSKEHPEIGSSHEIYVIGEVWDETRKIIVSKSAIRKLAQSFYPSVDLGVVDACYPVFSYERLKNGCDDVRPVGRIRNFKFVK